MDRFNSLDALVAESKKKFHMLIKFGSLENLERFQSGSLYMKNLRFYNELECEPGNGKPDKYDGKWRMNGGQFVLIDPSTSTLVASGTARETIFCYSDFCAIFEGLKSYVSEYKVQYIRPLTLAEIAFFEARMSLAKQAKGGIPHIYMKGCN